jgi:amidohydrolase
MLEKARTFEQQLIQWRRDFHMHPELGFEENRTAARIAEEMAALDYRIQSGIGRTGVVAELGRGQPLIAVRADMDALPIQEQNQVPYASTVPGVMHACGHDAHLACALGAAALLHDQDLPGTVRFLFQPAEEIEDDEGLSGAPRMIEDGALEDVAAIIALHVDSSIPVGDIGLTAGPAAAGVDTLYATIRGHGGHGSRPESTVDPIYIASHTVLALYGILARRVPAKEPAVISVGSIHGGQADNVIPEDVKISATIRYTKPEIQQLLHREIAQALGVARALGGDYDYHIVVGYPPMSNDPEVIELLDEVTTELMGPGHVQHLELEMGSEDFGFFSAQVPGAMFMLGCKIEEDERQHHNPRFDIDERCLPIGAAILAEGALRLLRQGGISGRAPS